MRLSIKNSLSAVGVTLALALSSTLAATPASAALVSACTVTLTPPAKISVGSTEQIFYVDVAKSAEGQAPDCVENLEIALIRKSDNRELSSWWIYSSDVDYQNGRVLLTLPSARDFAVSGVYDVVVTDARLSYSWAEANGANEWEDRPVVEFANSRVDVRNTSRATLSVTRSLDGVKFAGTLTRFDLAEWSSASAFVAQAGTAVALQKKEQKGWVTKKTVITSDKGAFGTVLKDTAKGTWRAVAQAAPAHWGVSSSPADAAKKSAGRASTKIAVAVEPRWDRSSVRYTAKVTFNAGGGFEQAPKGVAVTVQKRAGKAWKAIKTVKTDSSGAVTYSTKSAGTYRFAVAQTVKYKLAHSAARKW